GGAHAVDPAALVAAHPLLGVGGKGDAVQFRLDPKAARLVAAAGRVRQHRDVHAPGQLVPLPPRLHVGRKHRLDVIAELEVVQLGRDLLAGEVEPPTGERPDVLVYAAALTREVEALSAAV